MAAVGVAAQLKIGQPSSVFGFVQTPGYSELSTAAQLASQPTAVKSGLLIIPEAGIMMLAPQPLLQNMAVSQFTFPLQGTGNYVPKSAYTTFTDAANGAVGLLQSVSTVGKQWEADTVAALTQGEAFILRIGRGQGASGVQQQGAGNYACYIVIGDDTPPSATINGGLPVRLWLQDGQAPFLQYGTADTAADTWTWAAYGVNGVTATNTSDSSTLIAAAGRTFDILWIPDPDRNQLIVDLAGGTDTLVLTPPNQTADQSGSGVTYTSGPGFAPNPGRLKFFGTNGAATLEIFPMRFAASGTLTSGTVQLPFVYQGDGVIQAPGISLPTGTTADFDVEQGEVETTVVYTVALAGPVVGGLATATPVLTSIALAIPATGFMDSSPITTLDESVMSEVQVHRWLEYHQTPDNSFAVCPRCQVGINFDAHYQNFVGGTNGRHWAVQLLSGLKVWSDDAGGYVAASELFPQITGWTGMSSSIWRLDPTQQFDLIIEDRTFPLRTAPQCGNTYYDGWCWKSVIRWFAIAGGILPQFIDPLFFTCDIGPNPDGCTDFKLPVGTAVNPAVQFQADRSFWDCIMEVAGMLHAVIGFAEGDGVTTPAYLTAIPYYPGVRMTPNRGTITTTDYDYGDPNWLNTFAEGSVKISIDTSDRRTGVAMYGIDPATNLIHGTNINLADLPGSDPVTGVPWSEFTAAVHGFRQPLVNISKFNVDPVYTALYAIAMLKKLTMPTVKAEWFTLYHPGSFVLDKYTLIEPLTIPDGPADFSIESKLDTWSALNMSGPPKSSFMGRWVPNL